MKAFLKYLTDQDHAWLESRGTPTRFDEDDVILREGEERNALFVIRSGTVRVERSHMDFRYEISRFGPGEVFGEMGFVEGFVASANVVANEPVELLLIPAALIDEAGQADPAFRGRFYHSLAEILSQRLRETTVRTAAEFSWGGTDPEASGRVPQRYVPSDEDPWGGPSWDVDDDFPMDDLDDL